MRKLTLRHRFWLSLALASIVVVVVAGYVLTRPQPGSEPDVVRPPVPDRGPEIRRAKQLPEYAELVRYSAKENRPLTPAVVERAGELTTHPNYFIRVMATDVLRKAPDELKPRAAALVAARLKDEDMLVRQGAIHTLADLGAKEYVPQLRELLNDPDHRAGAKRALGMLGAGE